MIYYIRIVGDSIVFIYLTDFLERVICSKFVALLVRNKKLLVKKPPFESVNRGSNPRIPAFFI